MNNSGVSIYTTVIGLNPKNSNNNTDSQHNIAMLVAQLRQSIGTRAIFMKQGNEIIIMLTCDIENTNDDVIQDLCLWVNRYRSLCTDLYISVGFDKREIEKISSINESTIMARYHMQRSYMNSIPKEELNKYNLHGFMKVFKKILDDFIETSYKSSASDEMMEISNFIDILMVEYSEECIKEKK